MAHHWQLDRKRPQELAQALTTHWITEAKGMARTKVLGQPRLEAASLALQLQGQAHTTCLEVSSGLVAALEDPPESQEKQRLFP